MSLYGITVGKDIKFKEAAHKAGLDADLIDVLIDRPALFGEWVNDLRTKLAPPAPSASGLFVSPQQALDALWARASLRGWELQVSQLKEAEAKLPEQHPGGLTIVSFDVWLGDLPTTIEELWAWVCDVHSNHWKWDGLKFDKKHLRLLDAKRYGKSPSIQAVELQLDANWDKSSGVRPCDVRDPATSPGLELLVAAALHPEWVRQMDYETIPGVWLPGLEANISDEPWQSVPLLPWHRINREVYLSAYWYDYRRSRCAVPVRREL